MKNKSKIIIDKYNPKKKKDEIDKIECNKLFTRFARENIGDALILDAEDLRTTFWLKRRDFKHIIVPNPYVYDKIKRNRFINPINELVGKYISKTNKNFTTVWLDYCCSFDGNEEMRPQEDIKLLFKRKLLTDNSTFAITFSFRKHERVEYTGQDEDRVRNCIETGAFNNGYTAISKRTKRYKGMFFIIFKVLRN